jgi:hypothetical protein
VSFRDWYDKQDAETKEKVLQYAYENRPRPHVKLSQVLGFENTGTKFDLDLAQGQIAEDELAEILAGKVEVKTDNLVGRTGNLAVEFMCNDKPSGISASESPWWAFVFDGRFEKKVVVLVSKDRLCELLPGCRIVRGGDGGRAEMYLVPKEKLLA